MFFVYISVECAACLDVHVCDCALFAFAFAWYLMDINAMQTHVHRILFFYEE